MSDVASDQDIDRRNLFFARLAFIGFVVKDFCCIVNPSDAAFCCSVSCLSPSVFTMRFLSHLMLRNRDVNKLRTAEAMKPS